MLERSSLPYFRAFADLRDFTLGAVRKASFPEQACPDEAGAGTSSDAQAAESKSDCEKAPDTPLAPFRTARFVLMNVREEL